jgi:hypothetical protein
MLKTRMGMTLDQEILYRKFLPSRPPDHGFRDLDPLLIRECDGEREGFPWSHRQIPRETPPRTGQIPHSAVALKWPSVIRDGALHAEATVGTNGEGHGGLAGRRIVGGETIKPQGTWFCVSLILHDTECHFCSAYLFRLVALAYCHEALKGVTVL